MYKVSGKKGILHKNSIKIIYIYIYICFYEIYNKMALVCLQS